MAIEDSNKKKQAFTSLDNQQKRKRGSGFTNISRILDANKRNRLGSTIGAGLSGQYQDVQSQKQEKAQEFSEQSGSSRIGTKEDVQEREDRLQSIFNKDPLQDKLVKSPVQPSTDASGGRGLGAGRVVAPTIEQSKETVVKPSQDELSQHYAPSDEDVSAFERYRTAEYKGPKEIADFDKVQESASRLGRLGGLIGSTGGRQELLRRYVGQPGYTSGQKRLDTLLLGKSDPTTLNRARRQTQQLSKDVDRTQDIARGLGQSFVKEAERFKEGTSSRLGDLESAIIGTEGTEDEAGTGIAGRVQQLKEKEAAMVDSKQELEDILSLRKYGLEGKTPTFEDDVQAVGDALGLMKGQGLITPEQFDGLKEMAKDALVSQSAGRLGGNQDVRQMLLGRLQQTASENLTKEGVATKSEVARLNTLRELSGEDAFAEKGGTFKEGGVGIKGLGQTFAKSEDMMLDRSNIFNTELKDVYKKQYGVDMPMYHDNNFSGRLAYKDPKTNKTIYVGGKPYKSNGKKVHYPEPPQGYEPVLVPNYDDPKIKSAMNQTHRIVDQKMTDRYGDEALRNYAMTSGIQEFGVREVSPYMKNLDKVIDKAVQLGMGKMVQPFTEDLSGTMGNIYSKVLNPLNIEQLDPIADKIGGLGGSLTEGLLTLDNPITALTGSEVLGDLGLAAGTGGAGLLHQYIGDTIDQTTGAVDTLANQSIALTPDEKEQQRLKSIQDYINTSLNKGEV